MRVATDSLNPTLRRWGWLGPALAVGLFAGRLASELIHPGLIGAILITSLCLLLASFFLRRVSLLLSWPAFLLLLYVIYPEPDPRVAAAVALLALLSFLVSNVTLDRNTVDSRSRSLLIALFISLIALAIYGATLAQDVLPADSGEFQLVAAELGIAHPPGFTLYSLLAGLFARMTFLGSAATMVNFLSAITSAMTLGIIFLTVHELSGSILGGVVAAAALGTATTFWAQATTANIRSLTALFAALAFYAFIRYRNQNFRERDKSEPEEEPSSSSDIIPGYSLIVLFLLAITFGITHHPSLIFISILLLAALIVTSPDLLRQRRFWMAVAFCLVLALLPLIYIPVRAAANARGSTDELATLSGFLRHVLALGFRGDFFFFNEPAELWERLRVMLDIYEFQFGPALLVAMLVGFITLTVKDRLVALLLLGAILIHTLVSAVYRAPQTVEYLMPAYIPAAILLGFGISEARKQAISETVGGRSFLIRSASSVFVSVVILIVAFQFRGRFQSYQLIRENSSTRDYVEAIFRDAPASSVVLADWHWATPMWYLQAIEDQRTDLEISYVFPTDEPYAETWVRRIREEIAAGRPVLATHFDKAAYLDLPTPEPIGDAFLYTQSPRTELPQEFYPIDILFGDEIQFLGYELSSDEIAIGDELVATIAWKLEGDELTPSNIFAQLSDAGGQTIANDDRSLSGHREGINLTQFRLVPRPGTALGELELFIGAYGAEPLADADGRTRTPIVNLTALPLATPPFTENPVYRKLVEDSVERRLIGYDWDTTLDDRSRLYLHWQVEDGYISEVVDSREGSHIFPAHYGVWGIRRENSQLTLSSDDTNYVPMGDGLVWTGETIGMELSPIPGQGMASIQRFVSNRPIFRDLIVSVRLVGYEEDGILWDWWDLEDGVPALGAIPTLKWIAGSQVRDPRLLDVSEMSVGGQEIGLLLRLYDAFTQRPVPILDEGISQEMPWIPLGLTTVEPG